MSEDWTEVANAINERVKELGWNQSELVARSHVSSAIVREIQRNSVNRKRSPRTLESLSIALGWHPQHLDAILHGRPPPSSDSSDGHNSGSQMENIEQRLRSIEERLDYLQSDMARVLDHVRSSQQSREQ